jgi:hypothetical protein
VVEIVNPRTNTRVTAGGSVAILTAVGFLYPQISDVKTEVAVVKAQVAMLQQQMNGRDQVFWHAEVTNGFAFSHK